MRALFRPGNPSVLHVVGVAHDPRTMFASSDLVRVDLSESGFERVADMLDATFARRRAACRRNSGPGSTGRACSFAPTAHFTSSMSATTGPPRLLDAAGVPTAPVLATLPHGLLLDLQWRSGLARLPPPRAPDASMTHRMRKPFVPHPRNTTMPNLKLKLACWDYDRTRPLMDGRVKPDGIDLEIEILRPRHAFQRMLDNKEFQVSELSLASYTALKGRGDCPFVAVPVALSKIFRHSCIYVRTGAGIDKPEDLRGKRVGTSQWSSTGLVFMRGMLQHDYGIEAQDMHWFMGGLNTFVEPPLIPLDLPKDIRLDFLSGPADAGEHVRGGRTRRAAVALHPQTLSRRPAEHRAPVSEL